MHEICYLTLLLAYFAASIAYGFLLFDEGTKKQNIDSLNQTQSSQADGPTEAKMEVGARNSNQENRHPTR